MRDVKDMEREAARFAALSPADQAREELALFASRLAFGVEPGGAAFADVLAERQRQITAEGWSPEHDDRHSDGSLALAAACYAMFASVSDDARDATTMPADLTTDGHEIVGWSAWLKIWPWDRRWWKPKDRRRDLIRAGALIIAEIERLDRHAPQVVGARSREEINPPEQHTRKGEQ